MENIILWIRNNVLFIILILLCMGAIILSSFSLYYNNQKIKEFDTTLNKEEKIEQIALANEPPKNEEESYLVDIKGAIKHPGVYECSSSCIVNDVIKLAGGLAKNATTDNINLSKKVTDQMVIVVNTKTELKKQQNDPIATTTPANVINDALVTTDSAQNIENNSSTSTNSSLVNINTADLTTLTTISGIGESKAQSIIEYRNTNGPFKSIEDILNVTGIGEALFAKIKDYITI